MAGPPSTAPFPTIHALAATLAPRSRLAGIDLGTKTIGVAMSDDRLSLASPIGTVARKKFAADAAALAALLAGRKTSGIVYGLPVNMDGTEGPRCQATRAFALEFARRTPLPYCFWDERLSTAAVERMMIAEADMTRSRRAAGIDRAAAAYILQGALDALRLGEPD